MPVPAAFSQTSANLRGIGAMCAAMALFTVNDTFVKLVAKELPTHQIMFVRGIIGSVMIGTYLAATSQLGHWRYLLHPLVVIRTALEVFTAYSFITALGVLAIADVTAILLVSPLLITAISALLFGEDVRWRRWLAVIVGFIGMLIVVQPGSGAFQPAAFWALASTFAIAARDLVTRRLPSDIPTPVITAAGSLGSTILGGLLCAALPWTSVSAQALLWLSAAAALVIAGNIAIVAAFRGVDVSVVSPYRYTVMVWAVLVGVLVFGEFPSAQAWIGIALIVGSGLYALYRETKTRGRRP
jgi:drug/metabolite transporter (DMT)-like permease